MSMLQIEKRLQGWLWEAFRRTTMRKLASLEDATDDWLTVKVSEIETVAFEMCREERAADQISFRMSDFTRDGDELHLVAVLDTSEGSKLVAIIPKTSELVFRNSFGEVETR